jgi:hypothetical protein
MTRTLRSAVFQTLAFVGLNAAVLFVAAGRFSIAAFWAYLAIVTVMSGVALCMVDSDLLREPWRPGGRRPKSKVLFSDLIADSTLGYRRSRLRAILLVWYAGRPI